MPFISFACLIVLVRTSSIMLSRMVKARILALFLILGKSSQSFTVKYYVHCGFFIYEFSYIEAVSCIYSLLNVFNIKWYLILFIFSVSIEMIMCAFSFILLMWYMTLIDFHMSNHPCIPGMNPTWLWGTIA